VCAAELFAAQFFLKKPPKRPLADDLFI
jgi:hypothetical protein